MPAAPEIGVGAHLPVREKGSSPLYRDFVGLRRQVVAMGFWLPGIRDTDAGISTP